MHRSSNWMEPRYCGWKRQVILVLMSVILLYSLLLRTITAHLWRWTIRQRRFSANNPLPMVRTSLSPAIAKHSQVTVISCSVMWQQESLDGQDDFMAFGARKE